MALFHLGCEKSVANDPSSIQHGFDIKVDDSGPFAGSFSEIIGMSFEESDSALIAAVGETHVTADFIVVADMSEADVKLYTLTGRLRKRLGRKGRGPGEFVMPRSARIDNEGRAHVLDVATKSVSVFDTSGAFVRQVRLPPRGGYSGFHLARGNYVILGEDARFAPNFGFVVDSMGKSVRAFLPISNVLPRDADPSLPWAALRAPSSVVLNDTLFTILAFSDSLWATDLRDYSTTSYWLEVPNYQAPGHALRPVNINSPAGLSDWISSFHTFHSITAGNSELMISLGSGQGPSATTQTIIRDRNGRWQIFSKSPAISFVTDSTYNAFETGLNTRIRRYRRK